MYLRKLPAILVMLSLLGLAFGVGYVTYPLLHTPAEPMGAIGDPAPEPASQPDTAVYSEVWKLLDRDFYGDKPPPPQRNYAAIRGLVSSFEDPYTFFVEPEPRELERDDLRGRFGGIGANIELTKEGYALHPIPEQPADKAGILDGDLLLLVDDHEITPAMTVDELVSLVRGPVDSEVVLVVRRMDGNEPLELTFRIVRAEIELPSMEWRMLDEEPETADIGYMHLTGFTERSAAEMEAAMQELLAAGAARFILDLRGNPGGLVNTAVEIADFWLDSGIVLIEEKADGAQNTLQAKQGTLAGDAPLVVIVDGGSASASEILGGALQDRGRAKLVGEKTFGKGSVQLIHELSDQSSLHVTNAQWFTPNHHQITDQGLTPDVVVEPGADPLPHAIDLLQQAVPTATGSDATESE